MLSQSQPHTQPSASSTFEDAIVPSDGLNRGNSRHPEEEEVSESFVRSTAEMEEDDDDDSPRSALEAYTERLVSFYRPILCAKICF